MASPRILLGLALLTLLTSGLALFSLVRASRATQELALARQQILARDRIIIRQQQTTPRPAPATSADPTTTYVDTAKVSLPAAAIFADELGSLTGENLSNLMKAGLPEDPEAFLAADLKKHSVELLGGKVTDVRILTEHAALAAYDAPDLDGIAVLTYKLDGPGKVSWQVLADDVQHD